MTDAQVIERLEEIELDHSHRREHNDALRHAIAAVRAWEAVEKLEKNRQLPQYVFSSFKEGWFWRCNDNEGRGDTPQQAVLAAAAKLT